MDNPVTRMGARTRHLLAAYLLAGPSDAVEARLEELVQTGGESGTFGRLHLTLVQVLTAPPRLSLQILQLARDPKRMWGAVLDRVGHRGRLAS